MNKQLFAGIISAGLIFGLVACQQSDAPANQASQVAADRAAAANAPVVGTGTDKLVINSTGSKSEVSKGRYVHVRVTVDGKSILPSEGLCAEATCTPGMGWTQTDPGVFVFAPNKEGDAKPLVFMVDKAKNSQLFFSNTEQSGNVSVDFDGQQKTYDLYRTPDDQTQHAPIKLAEPLPEKY